MVSRVRVRDAMNYSHQFDVTQSNVTLFGVPPFGGMVSQMANQNALTIEQLAAESGMTVRNIRAHRARGLLPAPRCTSASATTGPSTSRG